MPDTAHGPASSPAPLFASQAETVPGQDAPESGQVGPADLVAAEEPWAIPVPTDPPHPSLVAEPTPEMPAPAGPAQPDPNEPAVPSDHLTEIAPPGQFGDSGQPNDPGLGVTPGPDESTMAESLGDGNATITDGPPSAQQSAIDQMVASTASDPNPLAGPASATVALPAGDDAPSSGDQPDMASTMDLLADILFAPQPPLAQPADEAVSPVPAGDGWISSPGEVEDAEESTSVIAASEVDDMFPITTGPPAYPGGHTVRSTRREPARKKPVGLIILLVVAILVAIAGVAAYVLPRMQADADEPGVAYSPAEAVREYLEALASADADTALLYSATKPASTDFLTDDFLATVLRDNPLTSISVPENQSSETPAKITATYKLGAESVRASFTVQQHGRTWLLDGGFIQLNLFNVLTKGVPLRLNGTELGADQKIDLFPGVYTLTSANPMLVVNNAVFVIEYPEGNPTFDQMRFALSEEGADLIRAASKVKLQSCLMSKDLRPEGCGFGFTGTANGTVDPATLTWTLVPESADLANTELTLEPNSVTTATGTVDVRVTIHAISTDQRYIYDDTTSVSSMKADFSDQDNIIVTFG